MTKQTNSKQAKFLDLIYRDISELVDRYDTGAPYSKEEFKQDLFKVVAKRVKQSFKNGIEIGLKRGQAKRQPSK